MSQPYQRALTTSGQPSSQHSDISHQLYNTSTHSNCESNSPGEACLRNDTLSEENTNLSSSALSHPLIASSTIQGSGSRGIPIIVPISTSSPHIPAADVTEQLLKRENNSSSHHPTPQFVEWGIPWTTPILMIVLFYSGVALAVGHHGYYHSLHKTPAGTKSRQRQATAFGTTFSFLIIALLRTAIGNSYEQYIWTLFRKKSFKLNTLDKLFALTTNPAGFFHIPLVKDSKTAVLVALISWYIVKILTILYSNRF